ncbi:hypothetical protein E4U59_000407 [Claviceps monticola]|nr:hypothetical protein E4U59_000407 [Claviceps monticola]
MISSRWNFGEYWSIPTIRRHLSTDVATVVNIKQRTSLATVPVPRPQHRSSPQRGKLFKAIAREAEESDDGVLLASTSTLKRQLVCNDATRWKSTYFIIRQALAKRDKVQNFLDLNNQDI